MEPFTAFRIHQDNDTIVARLEQVSLDDLSAGDVVIRTSWSGINYKDALAATGAGKILRQYPLVGGIDIAGVVVSSEDERFSAGDEVLVVGAGLSETRDGGYAEFGRFPADLVIPLPAGLSLREAMVIGTAGFSAGLAVHRMEQNGQQPDLGPVAVTGATGGVGSVAIDMLAGLGYAVTAISSKTSADEYLRELGAADVMAASTIEFSQRPLDKAIWGGAVDNLGGDMLGWLTRTTRGGGNIASVGLAAGIKLETTVMPFILRGVSLLGINSTEMSRELKLEIWRRIATDLKPRHLDQIATREVSLEQLPECFPAYIDGRVTGRTLVRLGD